MYLKIENHHENTTRIIDYPGTIKLFLSLHSMGFFQVVKTDANTYCMVDRFTGEIFTTVSKPGKREIAACNKGVN